MRSRFVSSVTHELKTPLANIHALAATLARQSQIPLNATRLSESAGSGDESPQPPGRQPARVCAHHRRQQRPMHSNQWRLPNRRGGAEEFPAATFGKWNHSPVRDIPDLPFVCVDQRAMTLALTNLIENATRHVRDNGHIRVSTSCVDSVVSIEVQDDGCGISTAKLAALRESIASREFPFRRGWAGSCDCQQSGR